MIVRTEWRLNPRPAATDARFAVAGAFAQKVPSPILVAQVTDGTTKTLMIAEKWVDQNAHGGAGLRTIAADSTDGTPTRCVSPVRRQRPTALFQTFPALIVNSVSTGGDNQAYMFGSAHASVLNAAFADGSVRSINYDIDPHIMNSLGTRKGTELSETTSMEGAN